MPKNLYNEDETDLIQATQAAQKKESTLILCILGLQTLLLVALLGGGMMAYHHINSKTDQIDAVVTIFENPQDMLNRPELVASIVRLMDNTTSEFFFGASDGSIPLFVANVLSTDLATWSQKIHAFTTDLLEAAENQGSGSCYQPVNCQTNAYVQCADGRERWCYDGVVNCALDSTCLAPSIATGASLISSVSSKLTSWTQVAGPSTANQPAFSNGVFRLNSILEWVKAQASSSDWEASAQVCNTFVQQAKAISWNGTYVDNSGATREWQANREVTTAADYVSQVCSLLTSLDSYRKKNAAPHVPVAKAAQKQSAKNAKRGTKDSKKRKV